MPCQCSVCGFQREIPKDYNDWTNDDGKKTNIYPVKALGQPFRETQGYICARCLRNANKMRLYIKMKFRGISIATHAVDRFLQRHKGERISEDAAKSAIMKMFSQARRIYFKEYFMIKRFKNNYNTPVFYYFHAGFIFVTTQEEPPTILTVEATVNKKLGIDFWYEE